MRNNYKIPLFLTLTLVIALLATGCTNQSPASPQTAATPLPQGTATAITSQITTQPPAVANTVIASPATSLAVKNADTVEIHGWVTETPGPWEGSHDNRIGPGETLTLISPMPADVSRKSVCIGIKEKTLKCTRITISSAPVIVWNGKDLV